MISELLMLSKKDMQSSIRIRFVAEVGAEDNIPEPIFATIVQHLEKMPKVFSVGAETFKQTFYSDGIIDWERGSNRGRLREVAQSFVDLNIKTKEIVVVAQIVHIGTSFLDQSQSLVCQFVRNRNRRTFAVSTHATVFLIHCDEHLPLPSTKREVVIETILDTDWQEGCADRIVDMLLGLQKFIQLCFAEHPTFVAVANNNKPTQEKQNLTNQLFSATLLEPCLPLVEEFQDGHVELECRIGSVDEVTKEFRSGVSRHTFFECLKAFQDTKKTKWVDTVDWYWGTRRGTATRQSSSVAPMKYLEKKNLGLVTYRVWSKNVMHVLRFSAKTEVKCKRPEHQPPTAVRIKRRHTRALENKTNTEVSFTIIKMCSTKNCSQLAALQGPTTYEIEFEVPRKRANKLKSATSLVMCETLGSAIDVLKPFMPGLQIQLF